ncbi:MULTISPECIES: DUF4390 domain-containing protein [unclassified Neisseria]|uniref:DUF4390 domain-containing protein n=1 Tax=unclassified Neisseria TaxID=2623750 RepID=UPI0026660FDF|nr:MULTISPECIES: DUF4390 domain-containing protein [unclassified Neisseria]MDO1510655.1 DUF4390 domain-containing protein [Neisseria sp. MVDL19-042950]MDO1516945.1 DUF4390 domain-containing protein [Neisseria sp. MVDL18-041461]MDO1564307.1 DUF4390 domain-containing protein [Neisseria sp. MVDL20-010259]
MAFITRLFRNSRLLLLPILLAVSFQTAAEGISATRAQAKLTSSGQLSVSSRFQINLPDQLKEVLSQGVPLNFTLSYQLSAPTVAAYRFKLGQIVGNDNSIQYKLSYHPLTNRYRVTVGTFSTEYNSLETALRGIGAIANWKVLGGGTLRGVPATEAKAEIRLELSTSQLPKPFQINALTSKSWQLDSGWKPLDISKE